MDAGDARHLHHRLFGNLLANTGAGLQVIAELAGHADVRTIKAQCSGSCHQPQSSGA